MVPLCQSLLRILPPTSPLEMATQLPSWILERRYLEFEDHVWTRLLAIAFGKKGELPLRMTFA